MRSWREVHAEFGCHCERVSSECVSSLSSARRHGLGEVFGGPLRVAGGEGDDAFSDADGYLVDELVCVDDLLPGSGGVH